MIWATICSWSCFCWLYRGSSCLAAKTIINLISVLTISKTVEKKGIHSSSGRAPKSQLAAEQPSTGECWILPKKDIPCPRAKEKLQQDNWRDTTAFKIKSQTWQRHSEGANETSCTSGLRKKNRNPYKRLSQTCPYVSPAETWASSDLPWGQGLWVQQTWEAQHVASVLLVEVTISTT